MTMPADMKRHFSRFLGAAPGRLHFAAHSHHPWPDVSFAAQQETWLDAARLQDDKWSRVLGEVLPAVQQKIAHILGLPDPASLVFAPNTHEFVLRVRSCLPAQARILTTDGEFHSFARQSLRWQEAGDHVERVPVEPFASFGARFLAAVGRGEHDLVYVSQVFFNSGFAFEDFTRVPDAIPAARRASTLVVVDGYHGFCARPTDLRAVAAKLFYVAGGYKYAMSGEGACFLHCPPGFGARPVNTGWYAGFGELEQGLGEARVGYAEGAARFWGSTFDPSGLYRMNAALGRLASLGLDAAAIHAHARELQARFLDGLDAARVPGLTVAALVPARAESARGNFLTFRTATAESLRQRLHARGVIVDHRADRLRFGFGVYHDAADVDVLLGHLRALGA